MVLACHKGWDLLFSRLCSISWRGPSSLAITDCGCRGRAKPGYPTALGERRVMAQITGGWGQHKAGDNPSAPMTNQGGSTTQPQNKKPHKVNNIHPGLGLPSPPKSPAASLRHHCAPAAHQHFGPCSCRSVFQEKSFFLYSSSWRWLKGLRIVGAALWKKTNR